LHFNAHCEVQGFSAMSCKKTVSLTKQGAVWDAASGGSREHVLHECRGPCRKGNLWWCLANWKAMWNIGFQGWVKVWAVQKQVDWS